MSCKLPPTLHLCLSLRFWDWSTSLGSLWLFSLLAVVEQVGFAPHHHGSLRSFAFCHSYRAEGRQWQGGTQATVLSTAILFGSVVKTESLIWDLKMYFILSGGLWSADEVGMSGGWFNNFTRDKGAPLLQRHAGPPDIFLLGEVPGEGERAMVLCTFPFQDCSIFLSIFLIVPVVSSHIKH